MSLEKVRNRNLVQTENAQRRWLLWSDVTANETTLDNEAGRSDVPETPDIGEVSDGIYRPLEGHNAALIQFFGNCDDNEICEFEILGYPLVDGNSKARGSVIAKAEVVFGTQNTGAIVYHPVTGELTASLTWREADTLRNQDATALTARSPLEFIDYAGFDGDDSGGLIYLSLRAWTYYGIRITALPTGPDRVAVGILPFTE